MEKKKLWIHTIMFWFSKVLPVSNLFACLLVWLKKLTVLYTTRRAKYHREKEHSLPCTSQERETERERGKRGVSFLFTVSSSNSLSDWLVLPWSASDDSMASWFFSLFLRTSKDGLKNPHRDWSSFFCLIRARHQPAFEILLTEYDW